MADGWQPLSEKLDLPAVVDVLAKRWSPTTDEFVVRRFTDIRPGKCDGGGIGYAAKFTGVEAGWYVTHFMTIPEPPKD